MKGRVDTRDRNELVSLLAERAVEQGERLFVSEIKTGTQLSFSELYQAVLDRQKLLEELGLCAGEKVCLRSRNSLEFMVNFYAILAAGGIVIPVNPDFRDGEVRYILEDSNAHFLLCETGELPLTEYERVVKSGEICSDTSFLEVRDGLEEDVRGDNLTEGTALIMYTSGTTGNAKGVMLTGANLLKEMENIRDAHLLTGQDRVLCVLPWFHINGLVVTMLTPLLVGHEIVIAGRFSVSQFWKWVTDYKITWFSGVPTIYSYLLERRESADCTSLRFARSASAPLPVHVLEAFEELYHVPIIESYGMTEGGSQLTSNPLPPLQRKTGSVGIPFGLEMKIEQEGSMPCGPDNPGEVCFRGGSLTKGYYKNPEATTESFENGWFKTGDLGYVDGDGYLYLCGRRKELINRSGEKIAPKEIEDILYRYPGVKLAACVGVPDPMRGEEIVAFCVPENGVALDADEIITFCRRFLADYKLPKQIFQLEELPIGGNGGKIQRRKLVEKYKQIMEDQK